VNAAEKREEIRLIVTKRRVQKMGNSLYVAIPSDFAKKMNLVPGEEVVVVTSGDTVRIMPIKGDI